MAATIIQLLYFQNLDHLLRLQLASRLVHGLGIESAHHCHGIVLVILIVYVIRKNEGQSRIRILFEIVGRFQWPILDRFLRMRLPILQGVIRAHLASHMIVT